MGDIHSGRRSALRAELEKTELDALLVTDLTNIRYLTGFTGSNAALLVHRAGETGTVFCTDGRYATQAAAEVTDLDPVLHRACGRALAARAAGEPTRYARLGFESGHVSVEHYDRLVESARPVALTRAPGLVERLRLIKDDVEIEALRSACAIADRALGELVARGGLRDGRTERELARELENRMFEHGSEEVSFATIVASGANSAIPHHRPGVDILTEGDLVKLDFGATVDGYRSDMTRMFVLGEPLAWQRELYDLVRRAQQEGRSAVRAGAEVSAVDRSARAVIEEAGYADEFGHGLGHGVGLCVHEAPSLSTSAAGTLCPGMAVTVEPGVYLAGRGGVRIEDTVIVRDDTVEVLSLSTRELVTV